LTDTVHNVNESTIAGRRQIDGMYTLEGLGQFRTDLEAGARRLGLTDAGPAADPGGDVENEPISHGVQPHAQK
jgi:hypothetical protein